MAQFLPKMSIYSEEVMNITEHRSAMDCIETISETLDTQKLVENILKTRPQSPPPIEVDIQPSEFPKPKPKVDPTPAPSLPENVFCQKIDSCDLKRPTQFTPNTVECQLASRIENATPQKWESPLTQAIRTTAPDADTFAQIPSKHSSSALASALSIAPSQVFTPTIDTGKPVPLPEETVPYFPPERPVIPVELKDPKSKPERPKSKFVKALETAPERPFTPVGGTPPIKKKPKDPNDKYFEDIPKPQEKLSMLTALTTAPERSYSPLIVESAGIGAVETIEQTQSTMKSVDRSQFQKPLRPDILPASFQMNRKEPKPPSYYSPSILYQRTEESKTEEHTEETDTSNTRTIERQTIHNPQVAQIIVDEATDNHIAPTFQAISCFYHNKRDKFSIEISTTPPVLTPPPKSSTPVVKTVETQPGYIEKETITEEKHARQQTTKKQEQIKEEIKGEVKGELKAFKQAEEVVLKKAVQPVILHKPEGLPAYQVQLSENVEADLQLMEKIQKAQSRLEQQKISQTQQISQQNIQQLEQQLREQQILQQQQINQQEQIRQHQICWQEQQQMQMNQQHQRQHLEAIKKPIITIHSDETKPRQTQTTFQPVVEDRPSNTTFSPRPGSITPSMINKPPPVLPYYQANLVPQPMGIPTVNLLDPKSPAVSRSPSPCPGGRRERSRSPSPFPSSVAAGHERAISPAPGPPPNPLTSSQRLPTPGDSKLTQARENLTTYIPEYKSKRDLIENIQGLEYYKRSEEESQRSQIQERQVLQSQVQQSQLKQSQMQQSQIQQSQAQQCRTQRNQSQQSQNQQNQTQRSQIQQKTQPNGKPNQMYVSQVQTQNFPIQQRTTQYESIVSEKQGLQGQQQTYLAEKFDAQEAQGTQKYSSQTADGTISTTIAEQSCQAHLEQMKKSQSQSVQKSADGLTQVQRKKTVTEEYERTHKEVNMQIEKNVTTTKKYPFHDVNAPSIEGPNRTNMHRTNPQPLTCSFTRSSGQINQQQMQQSVAQQSSVQQQSAVQQHSEKSCQQSCQQSCRQVCQKTSQQTAQPPTNCSKSQTAATPIKHVFAPSSLAPVKHVNPPGCAKKPNQNVIGPNVSQPDSGTGGGRQAGGISVTPKRGRGVLNTAAIGGARIPLCGNCNSQIRGPFITALGKIWCPNHFICATPSCRRPLQDLGFVEERGQLYCEYCFEQYLAPPCSKCNGKIKGDCLKAIGKNFHPECFNCVYCGKLFGNSPFFLEDGSPYCDADWNELFTTKCFACGFPVEAGDRWVEALNNNYHSQCFNCTMCKKNLEGQSFFAKGGRPFCKNHAR